MAFVVCKFFYIIIFLFFDPFMDSPGAYKKVAINRDMHSGTISPL